MAELVAEVAQVGSVQGQVYQLLRVPITPLLLGVAEQEATPILSQAHLAVIQYLAPLLQMAVVEAGQTQILLLAQTVALVAEQDAQVVQTPVERATRHLLIRRKDQMVEIMLLAHPIMARVEVAVHRL